MMFFIIFVIISWITFIDCQSYWSNVNVYELYPNFTIYDEGWIKCNSEYRAGLGACLLMMQSDNEYVGFWSFISICNQQEYNKHKINPFFDKGALIFGVDRNNTIVANTDHICYNVDGCTDAMCDVQTNRNVTLVVAKSFSKCKS